MDNLFCCTQLQPFKPKPLDHDPKFTSFLTWAKSHPSTSSTTSPNFKSSSTFVIQLVKQVNYGPVESKRYFITLSSGFQEVTEQQLIEANFQKLNAFKNFRCGEHNKFFELNVYMKDPVNKHHWRADVARPAGDIDL